MSKIYKIAYIIIVSLSIILLLGTSVSALSLKNSTDYLNQTGGVAGYTPTLTFTDIVAAIIQTLLGIVGVIFFIMIIVGGVTWMTAAGNPEKVGKAKKLIINAVIGLAIVTSAYSISYFIAMALEAKPQ
jgi:hypothetical protein